MCGHRCLWRGPVGGLQYLCPNSTGCFHRGPGFPVIRGLWACRLTGLKPSDTLRSPATTLKVFLIIQIKRHPSRLTPCFTARDTLIHRHLIEALRPKVHRPRAHPYCPLLLRHLSAAPQPLLFWNSIFLSKSGSLSPRRHPYKSCWRKSSHTSVQELRTLLTYCSNMLTYWSLGAQWV